MNFPVATYLSLGVVRVKVAGLWVQCTVLPRDAAFVQARTDAVVQAGAASLEAQKNWPQPIPRTFKSMSVKNHQYSAERHQACACRQKVQARLFKADTTSSLVATVNVRGQGEHLPCVREAC